MNVPGEAELREFEQRYQRALRLPTNSEPKTDEPSASLATALTAALDRAYDLRNFQIEHY